jgi:Spy/CpxP family protein refolding chaperone
MNHLTKGKVILYLAAIFVVGAAAGTVAGFGAGKEKVEKKVFGPPPSAEDMSRRHREKLQSRLGLTPEQMEKLMPLSVQLSAEMDALNRRHGESIKQAFVRFNEQLVEMLTPEQKEKFEAMERDRRERFNKMCKPGESSSSKSHSSSSPPLGSSSR